MKRTILIVEDEPSIVTLIQYNLEQEGFETDVSNNGEDALNKIRNNKYDLVILDIMLPKLDGTEVCRIARSENIHVPILMLTAKSSEQDKVYGLDISADDYLTKPFSPRELISRIHAILRRLDYKENNQEEVLTAGELTIYPDRFEAYFKGEQLILTRTEFDLLTFFMRNKGKVLSRDEILNYVWDYEYAGDTRTVDMQVSNLRDKIEIDTKNPKYIKTIRGFGYKLEEPV